ncbi:hypothetical protein GCM10010841_27930 [Deinococcus aerophilus]|uniref:Uncharacterized protein n=1 Tax=Deinococcus aerophilus TaxID=522488 RepID=A0ABQ2GYQ7_9DEIO|nr:hypothetical protein GCM10010841_27930 [Deinococcus aerophilus]
MKVRDSGMQGKEFLSSPSSFEAELSTFLLPSDDAARVKQLLDVLLAQGKMVAVGLLISHSSTACRA